MRLFEFVDAVMRLPRLDAQSLGALVGRPLTASGGNEYWEHWRLDLLAIGDGVKAAVELRQPKPATGATAGALLNLDLEGPCVHREVVERRFGAALRIVAAPTGRSEDEEGVYEVRVGERSVRFGFAERDPDCLAGLSFEFAP